MNMDSEKARTLLIEGKFQQAINYAKDFLDSGDTVGVKKILGLANFHLEKFNEALKFFEEVAVARNDTESWFNVMTSAVLIGNKEKEDLALNRYNLIQKENEYKQEPNIFLFRYYYTCALCDVGRFNDAKPLICSLKKIYEDLIITDPTFLAIRNLPYFNQFLSLSKRVFEGSGENFKETDFLRDLKSKVDDEGKTEIENLFSD